MEPYATLRVRLTPKGGRSALERFSDGVLYARVAAAPVDGGANRSLIRLLSDALNVPKTRITFQSGETSRDKILNIVGLTEDALTLRIEAALAKATKITSKPPTLKT